MMHPNFMWLDADRVLGLVSQDFLKEVDLQFLDHMRRGTSINFADLASDPPPANLQVQFTNQFCLMDFPRYGQAFSILLIWKIVVYMMYLVEIYCVSQQL